MRLWGVVTVLAMACVSCSGEDDGINYVKKLRTATTSESAYATYADQYPWAGYDDLLTWADGTNWRARSVAVLGGSLVANSECDVAKGLWNEVLHCTPVVSYARGGYGYATSPGSVQDFLPELQSHYAYVLWCSTNDYGTGVPVAQQKQGIANCIEAIRKVNADAIVVGFTSLRFFGKDACREDGYLEYTTQNNGQGISFREYVDAQRETFEEYGIPYFDQYYCGLFDLDNWREFYQEDGYHLTKEGYFVLGCAQTRFLLNLINGDD